MSRAPPSELHQSEGPDPAGGGSRRSKLVVWLAVLAGLLLGMLVIGGGTWLGHRIWNIRAFRAEHDALAAILTRWQQSPPARVDPRVWREVVVVVHNAMGNVCFTYQHVPVAEMRRLRREVEAQARGPVTLDTLEWLWNRLGQTSPHGAEYIQRMRPLWDEARDAAEHG
jgi:hypothetical protein